LSYGAEVLPREDADDGNNGDDSESAKLHTRPMGLDSFVVVRRVTTDEISFVGNAVVVGVMVATPRVGF